MLGVLPTEIILSIFSFLPLRQLHRLLRISKPWKSFIKTNESDIYHSAAVLHGFVPPKITLNEAKLLYIWLNEIDSWKMLCYRFYRMERRWEGREQPTSAFLGEAGKTVWRFKIDQRQRSVITTHTDGGLRVSTIGGDEVLWSTPHTAVHPYAHCEYTNGYLVFTRRGNAVDVWRRKRDSKVDPSTSSLYSDEIQKRANRFAYQSSLSTSMDDRGAFVPWTVIVPPNSVRALRAVNSSVLLASSIAQEGYIYDLPTGSLKQTVSFRRRMDEPPIEVNYVELGIRHIFVCSLNDVLVVPLQGEDTRTSLKFPSQIPDFHEFCDNYAYRIEYHKDDPVYVQDPLEDDILIECVCERGTRETPESLERSFTAVHVSPCGKHFVTTDELGYLCIIRNFEDAMRRNTPLQDYVTVVDMGYPIMNLAFEDDKRIVVYVDRRGIFVISFVSQEATPIDTYTMDPVYRLRVLHAKYCDSAEALQFCSCLQLTRSEIWYSWTEMHAQPELGVANNFLRRIRCSVTD